MKKDRRLLLGRVLKMAPGSRSMRSHWVDMTRLPERLLCSFCVFLLGLLFTTGIHAQDPATKKLAAEAALLRESKSSPNPDLQKATKEARDRREGLTNAIRDWVELRLPKSKDASDTDYSLLQDSMKAELIR